VSTPWRARVGWDCGTRGIGVLVGDSLMFQREQPTPSDPNMAHFYGLALPLLKRGLPVTPVQLENADLPGFLDDQRVLLLSYQGQKPLSAEVHPPLAGWVRKGGVLVVVDDDSDPYNRVREWWNGEGKDGHIPRDDLFGKLGVTDDRFSKDEPTMLTVGKGAVIWVRENPVRFALSAEADARLAGIVRKAATKAGLVWKESNHLALRRGPYVIGAGLDESVAGAAKELKGRFVNLFDPELKVRRTVVLEPGTRAFLLDLDAAGSATPQVIASACKALPSERAGGGAAWTVEGVGDTPAVVLIATTKAPRSVRLEQHPLTSYTYDPAEGLLYVRFPNEARPRDLVVEF